MDFIGTKMDIEDKIKELDPIIVEFFKNRGVPPGQAVFMLFAYLASFIVRIKSRETEPILQEVYEIFFTGFEEISKKIEEITVKLKKL